MIVTDIIEISKKQCKIMIDHEFAFVLYKGELRSHHIKKGESVAEEDYHRIINELLTKRAKLRALNLLKSRAYTEKRLRGKLQWGQYPQSCIEEAVAYVKSYGYVDDGKYAADYLFYHGNKLNRQQAFLKLRQRGIPEEIIQREYDKFCDSQGMPDELEMICRILQKKHYDVSKEERGGRGKIIRTLLSKGFSYDKIMEALSIYGKNDE